MKKAMILLLIIVLTLSYKVDALALDGYINDELRIFDNERAILVNNSNPVDDVNFAYTPNTSDNKYAVFPIRGVYYNERYTNNLSAIEDTVGFLHIYLKTNKNWLACETQNNFIVCPVPTNANMLGLYFQFGLPTTWTGFEPTYEFYLYATVNMYKLNETQLIEAINEQSEQQQQQHNEVMNELNQTQTYTEDMNTNMTGVNETIEYSTQEQNLKSQLDLNTSMLDDLYIDSSTSGFIWDLVGGLRNMNPAIITLMSTMLGLGVIRLILNR